MTAGALGEDEQNQAALLSSFLHSRPGEKAVIVREDHHDVELHGANPIILYELPVFECDTNH